VKVIKLGAVDLTNVPTEVVGVAERAQKATWDVEWAQAPDAERPSLYICIPNGRDKRRQFVGPKRAERLVAVPFEKYRLLGSYAAINNSSENYIEAYARVFSRFPGLGLADLPGAEIIEAATVIPPTAEEGDAVEETVDSSTERERAIRAGARWRLRVEDARHLWSIEFSEASDAFLALSSEVRLGVRGRRPTTLKIQGINAPRHEDAVRWLEDISGAIFFDLDLCYGIQVGLVRVRSPIRLYRPEPLGRALSLPRLRYPSEALSLYWYGRSAFGMPLLQFLAYYQVLEYFFPVYFRQHLLRRLRQELTDPRFDVTDDAQLARLLNTMTSSGRAGYGSERDQLKATIDGCVDESIARAFLVEDPERLRILGDKKAIRGVPLVVDDGHHGNLIEQITARIYGIRCRVVHAKADGGDTTVDLLLPSSPEADSLHVDVSILQFLAQKAIVAGGTPFS
jgi:hypothetical protein